MDPDVSIRIKTGKACPLPVLEKIRLTDDSGAFGNKACTDDSAVQYGNYVTFGKNCVML
jgi:hypothetical protein